MASFGAFMPRLLRLSRQEVCSFNQLDKLTNHQEFAADNTGEKDGLTNLFEIGSTKENAANLAGFNGVKEVVEFVCFFQNNITAFPILATHWGTLL
jgi:hypothetical protein